MSLELIISVFHNMNDAKIKGTQHVAQLNSRNLSIYFWLSDRALVGSA
jgi:hypothetical protein